VDQGPRKVSDTALWLDIDVDILMVSSQLGQAEHAGLKPVCLDGTSARRQS
jgi:hypothetical protein